MEIVHGFFDYCVSEQCFTAGNFEAVAKRLLEFGYRTVAVNQIFDDSALEQKKKKKKGEARDPLVDIVPPPVEIKKLQDFSDLKILNRLTIVFSNQEIMFRILKSANYKKYHIIAVQPTSQPALQFICSSVDADILTYNPESKAGYKINRKLYNQLVDKGFHFEILYSPAIRDSTQRKNSIAMSHLYHAFGKSKNVIISSGATDIHLLRNSYDIVNLGLIFGLSEAQSKDAIQNCGRNVFIHAVGRRHGKALMFVENVDDEEMEECEESSEKDDEEMELDQPAQKKSKQ